MQHIVVRRATQDDLEVLFEFEQGVILAERPYDPTLANEPISYYDLPKLITSEDAEIVVAMAELQIVGCGYALIKDARRYLDHDKYAYLGFMYTCPDFRGRAINAKILDALKSWSTEKGLIEMRLNVYDENLSALKAYEKYGFKKHILEMRLPR